MSLARRAFLLLVCCCFAAPAFAGARDQLNAFSQGLLSMQANFEQRVFSPNGKQTELSTGVVKLRAPRQFRWEYQQPFPQLIVADGDQIWIYDPDLEQVTVRNQSFEEQSSPLAALIDPGELDRQFKSREGGQGEGLDWLELHAKKPQEAPFERARLGFGKAGLQRMELFDGLGQRTLLTFSPWQRNPNFAADVFRFSPPAGVDVVGDVIEGAEVTPLRD